MFPLRGKLAAPWPVLAGILVVAVVAWGMYAIRFSPVTKGTGQEGQPAESVGEDAATSQPMPDGGAGPAGAGGSAGPSASVSANAPASVSGQNEMHLKPGAAVEKSAAAPAGSPAAKKPAEGGGAAAKTAGETPTPAPAAPTASAQLDAGRAALARGELLAARSALSAALREQLSPADAAFARTELERIADALLFSRAVDPNDPLIGAHVVGGGDSLVTIAQQYKITDQLLASINRISDPNRLLAGQRLKVIRGPFSAVIHKTGYRMDVYLGDVYVRGFKVGLGTNDGTPRGTWVVRNKLTNPEWTDPTSGHHYAADDPDNPIGERWIGLHCIEGDCIGRTGFGLHGTIDPASIGQNMSMGCIRLKPEEIAFVYDLFVDGASRIVVR